MPGVVHLLSDVPDPVFAQGVVGPGLALEPIGAGGQDVVAPIPGRIAKLHPHAFVIASDDVTVLVHLGIDTVQLNGAGFVTHAAEGDEVAQVTSSSPGSRMRCAQVVARQSARLSSSTIQPRVAPRRLLPGAW